MTWLEEFSVEELDWPTLSPDFHPIIKRLLDEPKWKLQAMPSHPTSVPDLTNALLDDWGTKFPQKHSKILWKAFREAVLAEIGGPTPY